MQSYGGKGYPMQGGYGPPQGMRPPMHHQAYGNSAQTYGKGGKWQPGQGQGNYGQGQGHPMAGHGPATGSEGHYGGPAAQRPAAQRPVAQRPVAQRGGPPKREMDSLLEEIKAKQRLQEQKKEEILKNAERMAVENAAAEAPGANQRQFPQNHGGFPQNQGGFGQNQAGFGQNQGGFGQNQGGFGQNQGGFGQNQGGFGQNQGGFGQNQGGFGQSQSQPGFGQNNDPRAPASGGNYGHGSYHAPSGSLRAMAEESLDKVPPKDAGPAHATTLYCKELPRSINEDTLCQLFSRYGVVVGVSILHARDGKDVTCGWVTMDRRESASRAKDNLDDRDVDGVPMWIEFAKGPAPQVPDDCGTDGSEKDSGRHIMIQPPADRRKRMIIDQMAKYVSQEGHQFEMIIMEKEPPDGNHEDFSFLFNHDSPENRYYRWRVFAFAQGDNFRAWRTQSFRICDVGGAWWKPPHCEVSREVEKTSKLQRSNFSTGPISGGLSAELGPNASESGNAEARSRGAIAGPKAESRDEVEKPPPAAAPVVPRMPAGWTEDDMAEERERCRLEEKATQERQKRDRDKRGIAGGKRLSDHDWDKFELCLRSMSATRCSILETMVFTLDKSDSAIEIAEAITESLTILETEMSMKLARLMLVSDILHNTTSSKPAAWAYRREFEKSLPDILEHMHLSLMRVDSKIMLEKLKGEVLKILHVWEDWALFAPQYTRGLEAALVVGVKSLRHLRSKSDTSREPAWIELKLNEWRRQHFSQLEKMCRTRGLRSSTAHLEPTKTLSLEEVRREWLVDRLVCYELHWHEKEQERASEKQNATSRSKRITGEDIDGEAIECDIDGSPLEELAIDGEEADLNDLGALIDHIEATRVPLPNNLGRFFGAEAIEEVEGMRSPSPQKEPLAFGGAAPLTASGSAREPPSDDELLDIEKPEDPSSLEVPNAESPAEAVVAADIEKKKELEAMRLAALERAVLRDVELEVMELRASLAMQGLHRDAIQDICEEKRQQMMKEHEASIASPMNKDGEHSAQTSVQGRNVEDESDSDSSDGKEKERSRAREKEREREKKEKEEKEKEKERKEKEREKEKEKKEKEKAKEKEKEKAKSRAKDADSDSPPTRRRSRSRDRVRDKKDKEKEKDKDKDKEKDRAKKKRVSRSRSSQPTKRSVSRSRSREPTKKKKGRK